MLPETDALVRAVQQTNQILARSAEHGWDWWKALDAAVSGMVGAFAGGVVGWLIAKTNERQAKAERFREEFERQKALALADSKPSGLWANLLKFRYFIVVLPQKQSRANLTAFFDKWLRSPAFETREYKLETMDWMVENFDAIRKDLEQLEW
jgi:hypothetical protein